MISNSAPRILGDRIDSNQPIRHVFTSPYREKPIDPHTRLDDFLDPVSRLIVRIMRKPESTRSAGDNAALLQWLNYRRTR